MKISRPEINEPLTKGHFLYSVVEALQQEEDIIDQLFQADEIETIDESHLEFKNCIFQGCKMFKCSLEGCSTTDILFENCDLSNLILSDLSAQRVRFEGCKLVGTQFPNSFLQNVVFKDCNCRYANFSSSKLKGVEFDSCFLQDASMDNLNWKKFSINNCDLTRANLCHTSLNTIDLRTCQTDAIVLTATGEELKGAIVTQLQALDFTRFLGLEIR